MTDFQIRADRASLADAAAWVAQALPKKHAAPATFGIRLTAEAEALTLTAFDFERSMTATIPAEVMASGQVLVAGHFLRQIVAAIKGKQVELALDGNRLTIAAGRSTYRVGVMALEDYPKLPDFPEVVGRIEADELASAIGTVEHAASRDDALAILTAAHLESDGDDITIGTTDRFRFATASAPWDGEVTTFSVDVPVAALAAILKGLSGPLEIGVSGGLFGLRDATRSTTTRVFDDGGFPNLASFLDEEPAAKVEVDAAALAGAFKRAAMVVDDREGVWLRIADGEIEVDAEAETGEGSEFVECSDDVKFEAFYNPLYMTDALGALSGSVVLGLPRQGSRKPLLTIHPVDGDVTLAVMPRKKLGS